MRGRSLRTALLGAVVVTILLVMAALATRVPTGEVLWVEQPETTQTQGGTLPNGQDEVDETTPEAQHETGTDDVASRVVSIFWVAVFALVVLVASLLLIREKAKSPEVVEEAWVDPPHRGTLREATSQAVDDALHSIRAGAAPRNAIVECWRSLGRAVAESGVGSDASRTSSELVAAIVEHTHAHPSDVEHLGALYRQARYSGRLSGDDEVQAAQQALTAIQDALRK